MRISSTDSSVRGASFPKAKGLRHAIKVAKTMNPDQIVLINLSGRGDKDIDEVRRILNERAGESA